jgi:hypothetical protein
VGTARRILMSNIESYNSAAKISSIFSGIPGHEIEDMKLSDIYVHNVGGGTAQDAAIKPPEMEDRYPEPGMFGRMPASGFYMRHVRNLEMSHVEVRSETPDARPAFVLQNVERADLFALNAARSAGHPMIAMKSVKDFRLGWTRGIADTTLEQVDDKTLG